MSIGLLLHSAVSIALPACLLAACAVLVGSPCLTSQVHLNARSRQRVRGYIR
jgi:hypothetical protein